MTSELPVKSLQEICELIDKYSDENPTIRVLWINDCGPTSYLYEVAVKLRQLGYHASVRPNNSGLAIRVRL
jgi:hypothetical protein